MTTWHALAGDEEHVAELIAVLTLLEDFLIHADEHLIDDLTGYRPAPLQDPHGWTRWAAELLGEHAAALRSMTAPATTPPHRIGAPR